MAKPIRIQRKRTKGWRMPENTVYVGRPTKWGNPYRVLKPISRETGKLVEAVYRKSLARAVELYRHEFLNRQYIQEMIPELRGKNLACWCPLDQACHADVLLEIANQEENE